MDSEAYQDALRMLKQGRTWEEVAEMLPIERHVQTVRHVASGERDPSVELAYAAVEAAWDEIQARDRQTFSGLQYAMQAVQRAKEGGFTDKRYKEVMSGLKGFADSMLCD